MFHGFAAAAWATSTAWLAPGESAESFVQGSRVVRERGFDHGGLITRGTPLTEETVATVAAPVDGD